MHRLTHKSKNLCTQNILSKDHFWPHLLACQKPFIFWNFFWLWIEPFQKLSLSIKVVPLCFQELYFRSWMEIVHNDKALTYLWNAKNDLNIFISNSFFQKCCSLFQDWRFCVPRKVHIRAVFFLPLNEILMMCQTTLFRHQKGEVKAVCLHEIVSVKEVKIILEPEWPFLCLFHFLFKMANLML